MVKSPRSLASIVENQVHRWEARRPTGAPASVGHRPVITVSREYGARGALVAQRVAERLGFEVWDKALVHEIAKDSQTTARVVETLDEHRRNTFADVLSNFMRGKSLTSADYLARLARTVHTIAGHGAAVIVGRGAQHLLGDHDALVVRVVAPLADRIAGIMERRRLDKKAAAHEMKSVEDDRSGFVKQTYGVDIADPTNYDIVVNLGRLSIDQAADAIAAVYRARFGG
ncbi:MAG: hypothetical protein CSA66_00840 [Proteobacteria bacterium]|nr:MAG: hypothetical protein CSA66_00840 [Pseudomonadota bacterium]